MTKYLSFWIDYETIFTNYNSLILCTYNHKGEEHRKNYNNFFIKRWLFKKWVVFWLQGWWANDYLWSSV